MNERTVKSKLAGVAAELRFVKYAIDSIAMRGESYKGERAYYLQAQRALQNHKQALERSLGYGRSLKRTRSNNNASSNARKRR